jgi:serine/threonine-protein kinase
MGAETNDMKPGTVLDDRFEILDEIARGGFGMVYRARQLNVDREVAVKTIPPERLHHTDVVERFKREAKLASRLSHPNTVTIHDYGQHGETLFLVMEFLDGEDLADVLSQTPTLSQKRIIRIARQVLRSLAEAHEYNIIHRDLKPENIFLSSIGHESDFVKVVDFGIAKLTAPDQGPADAGKKLTVEGNTVGTPTYMAPEQAAGGEVDARSDIYALGVIMWEMACGHAPYEADEPAALMRNHIFEDVPRFDDGSLRDTWLESVVLRALAKDKEDRFPDARSFLRALDEEDPRPSETSSSAGGIDVKAETDVHSNQFDDTTPSSIVSVIEESSEEDIILLDQPKHVDDDEPMVPNGHGDSVSSLGEADTAPSDRSESEETPSDPSNEPDAAAGSSDEWSWTGEASRPAEGTVDDDIPEESLAAPHRRRRRTGILMAMFLFVAALAGTAYYLGFI